MSIVCPATGDASGDDLDERTTCATFSKAVHQLAETLPSAGSYFAVCSIVRVSRCWRAGSEYEAHAPR